MDWTPVEIQLKMLSLLICQTTSHFLHAISRSVHHVFSVLLQVSWLLVKSPFYPHWPWNLMNFLTLVRGQMVACPH
uniref:Kinesin-like protein KCA2 n=1 Tax=Rhizophora mucronata TaxID=61149 RepID=A0A2P2MB41_RHIMU